MEKVLIVLCLMGIWNLRYIATSIIPTILTTFLASVVLVCCNVEMERFGLVLKDFLPSCFLNLPVREDGYRLPDTQRASGLLVCLRTAAVFCGEEPGMVVCGVLTKKQRSLSVICTIPTIPIVCVIILFGR